MFAACTYAVNRKLYARDIDELRTIEGAESESDEEASKAIKSQVWMIKCCFRNIWLIRSDILER